MLNFRSNQDLIEADNAEARVRQTPAGMEQFESSLAAHIRRQWETNRRAKDPVTTRLLKCLRQRNGEYDPEDLAEIRKTGGSEIFMMLTATKCRAGAAWIRDIMLPATDKPWGLEPTPIPQIPAHFEQLILRRVQGEMQQEMAAMQEQAQAAQQQGQAPRQQPDPARMQAEKVEKWRERIKELAEQRANKAAEAHEKLIEDQLDEGNWQNALEDFIEDFVTYSTAIIKGPIIRRRPTFTWDQGFIPRKTYELRYEWEAVSPFDCYPSPGSVSPQDGTFIEHVRFTRRNLWDMIGQPGYSEQALREVLNEYGRGGLREWMWRDEERRRVEGRENEYITDYEMIDGIHYWGSAQGLMLLEWGVPAHYVDEPLGEYEIEAILIGRHVIRVEINTDPLSRRPYGAASYQRKPGSFWGMSVPELMESEQRVCNASARALVNNMAIASGPQVEIYANRLADGEEITALYPWKIWQTADDGMGTNNRAINFFQPTSNAQELMGVFEEFERRADDSTNIPRYAYGNQEVKGAGSTMGGLAMLLDAASKGIKAAIGHIDQGVIRPTIDMLWFNNMLYEDDPSIKGDCKVVPRGTAILVAKDQRQLRLADLLQVTSNDIDMQILGIEGRAKILLEFLRTADIPNDALPTIEEVKAEIARKAQQPTPDQIDAQLKDRELQLKDKELGVKAKQGEQENLLKAQEQIIDSKLERRDQDLKVILQEMQAAHERQMAILTDKLDAHG